MALGAEQVGRMATIGAQRLPDLVPERLHESVSVIPGSRTEVQRPSGYRRVPA